MEAGMEVASGTAAQASSGMEAKVAVGADDGSSGGFGCEVESDRMLSSYGTPVKQETDISE